MHIYKDTKRFPKKEIYGLTSQIKRGARGCRENAKSDDQITGKQTLESLNPRLLEPFLPTNWEKIQTIKLKHLFIGQGPRELIEGFGSEGGGLEVSRGPWVVGNFPASSHPYISVFERLEKENIE